MSKWLAVVSIYLESLIFENDCQLKLGMLYLPNQKPFFIWPSFSPLASAQGTVESLGKRKLTVSLKASH